MSRPAPPNLGPYQYHEVLSSFRKTVKLNDPEGAIYWLTVLLEKATREHGSGAKIAATQLWIMAAEDIDDPAIVQRAFAVYSMVPKVGETDHLYFLTYAMCKARKWWEHAEGREVDELWAKALGDLRDPDRHRPIPAAALDRHTRRGWARFRNGQGFDDRYSGTELGRMKTVYLFLRDGAISARSALDGGFAEFWHRRRILEAKPVGEELNEPGEPGTDDWLTPADRGETADIPAGGSIAQEALFAPEVGVSDPG